MLSRTLCRSPVFLILILILVAPALGAQRIAPAAVVAHSAMHPTVRTLPHDDTPSLAQDMRRGAAVGSVTGALVGLVGVGGYVWANTRETCCEQPEHHVRFPAMLAIEATATAGGALVGSVLGYAYHFNRPPHSSP